MHSKGKRKLFSRENYPSEGKSAQFSLRGKILPQKMFRVVSRQFLTRYYPRPNRLLKCLPNCLSPTGEGIFSSFKITPAVRVIARQLRDKNCPGAIFAPGHQDVSQGPLGTNSRSHALVCELQTGTIKPRQIRTPSWKTPQRTTYSQRGCKLG